MAQNHISDGNTIEVALTSGQTGFKVGDVYEKGALCGVILSLQRDGQTVFNDVASAEGDIAIVATSGVFEVTKEAPLVIGQGDALYFDASAGEVDKTNTNTPIGFAFAAAGSADTVVQVLLKPWAAVG
jgi:predicted RecA/RadA family phage recombinase